MTKSQLRAYKELRRERDNLARLLAELEAVIYSPRAQQLHGMPRNGSGAICPTENLALKRLELEAKYKETVEALTAQMAEIEDAIQVLEPRERTIIRLHYFQGYTWEQVAVETGYTWRHVHRLHGKALEKLQNEEGKI
jgi:RNA polymerase sigma factor (sigma-70 family)